MRTAAIAILVGAALAASPVEAGCKDEVKAAFVKQRTSKGWRAVTTSMSAAGVQEQTFEYVPPDRMYRKVVAPGLDEPQETIGVAKWAWSNEGGGWFQMQPHMAQMVSEHMRAALNPDPPVTAEYACLGKVTFEGKEYLGYQTPPEDGGDGSKVARTIYIDAATGLPAFNTVGKVGSEAAPDVKEAYTYPADLMVDPPVELPGAAKE